MIPGAGSPTALLEPVADETQEPLQPRFCCTRYTAMAQPMAEDPYDGKEIYVLQRPSMEALIWPLIEPRRHRVLCGAVYSDSEGRAIGHAMAHLIPFQSAAWDPRELLLPGFLIQATGVVLWIHRPGNDLKHRAGDQVAIQRLVDVGLLLGVRVLNTFLLCSFSNAYKNPYHSGFLTRYRHQPVEFYPLDAKVPYPRLTIDGRRKPLPMYYDPKTGDSWSGLGSKPRWLRERSCQERPFDFLRIRRNPWQP